MLDSGQSQAQSPSHLRAAGLTSRDHRSGDFGDHHGRRQSDAFECPRGQGPVAVARENEAEPRLVVDAPLPEPLSHGRVFIQYRTENIPIVPVFGVGALDVSPRKPLHITVDDLPWHFVDANGQTLIVVGLKPGRHRILIELADPTHWVITSETIEFVVPNAD
ncbi:DUF6130 family protein [Rhizobium sp. BK176]|uniref:DUF6130 family protein n=1 Tax=Rhizobium sp. BK176 TaxID=2587071 RepID=UPI0021675416|nr:DUF6130 family protein [Rhizobium sp. BK176]